MQSSVGRFLSTLLVTTVLSVATLDPVPALAQPNAERAEIPPWPLAPLDRDERQARLRLFTHLFDYEVENVRPLLSEKVCTSLLKKLSEPDDVNILEPVAIAPSRDDPAIPHDIVRKCPRVEFDRVWWSNGKGLLEAGMDQTFDALPLGEKDKAADYYYAANGPIEFYDLSEYYDGKATIGSFAENTAIKCNNTGSPICGDDRVVGYRRYAGVTLGPVVDVSTCSKLLPPKVKVQSRLLAISEKPYQYHEKSNVFAFIDIGGKLYRIGAQMRGGSENWADRLNDKGGATIIVERSSSSQSGLCIFESTSNRKE